MILLLLGFLACNDEANETAEPVAAICEDAPALTWGNWGDGFFANYCRACHSANVADRWGAPEGIDFDTLEEVQHSRGSIMQVAIDDGTMPVGGGVYEEDLEALEIFLSCGL